MVCSERACSAAVCDWRYCQIDVATSPATPITKLDRKLVVGLDEARLDFGGGSALPGSIALRSSTHGPEYIIVSAQLGTCSGSSSPTSSGPSPSHCWSAVAPVIWRVLPPHLARARRGGPGLPARAARARRDRLPAAGRADAGARSILTCRSTTAAPDFFELVRPPGSSAASSAHPGGLGQHRALRRALLRAWWALTRIGGYLCRWRCGALFFRRDNLARLRPAQARLSRARLDLRAVRGRSWCPCCCSSAASPTSSNYYPMYKRRAARGWTSSSGRSIYIAPVLHAGDLLPRLVAARDARVRRGRHLVDGGPLLHGPLRQALPGGVRARWWPAWSWARCR